MLEWVVLLSKSGTEEDRLATKSRANYNIIHRTKANYWRFFEKSPIYIFKMCRKKLIV
jgi:hypothetical protein